MSTPNRKLTYPVGSIFTIGKRTQAKTGLGRYVVLTGTTEDHKRAIVQDAEHPERTAEISFVFGNIVKDGVECAIQTGLPTPSKRAMKAKDIPQTEKDAFTRLTVHQASHGDVVSDRKEYSLIIGKPSPEKPVRASAIAQAVRVTARDTYIKVFGRLESLAERISWATGVSNMLEWLTWDTSNVLGITKTQYWKRIVAWSVEDAARGRTLDEKLKYVADKLDQEIQRSEQSERYAARISEIASPREALRRAKFFSEDYLNKEFDIFWTLVSDKYLDAFYSQFTPINGGGRWSTHGNSGLFMCSTGIKEMQMDNLSYNETEALLVANELKLGGKKNRDQILKYALMFKLLRDKKFIVPESRFLLLFIGGTREDTPWEALIEAEISFCKSSSKSTARAACEPEVVEIARSGEFAHTSWSELTEFNNRYAATLDPQVQQVEHKLLWGFNESLAAKKFMQGQRSSCPPPCPSG